MSGLKRMNKLRFFFTFLKDPGIASILPSSKYVLNRVLSKIDPEKVQNIVEYGPGTGHFSEMLLARLRPESRLIVIERNPTFCSELRKIKDRRFHLIQGDAKDVKVFLSRLGLEKVDMVLSSIPLSLLSNDDKDIIFGNTKNILSENGKFIVYSQWVPHAKQYLQKFFTSVKSQIELRNFPPAFIFEAAH